MNIEIEVLHGVPLFVDHIKQNAFLKDPKYIIPYESAVQAITNLGMKCDQIITDTMFKYEVPSSTRLTSWQKNRLIKMAENGCSAYEIANSFGVSEEAVIKAVGKIIKRKEREAQIITYQELSKHYAKLANNLTNAH